MHASTISNSKKEESRHFYAYDGPYVRRTGAANVLDGEVLEAKIITALTLLAERGFTLDEIATEVEMQLRNPNAILALGMVYAQYAMRRKAEMERAKSRQPILKVSRRVRPIIADKAALIARLAARVDILWTR